MIIVVSASQLAVAGLLGLAVGLERERSGHTTGPDSRFAGLRTFLLVGLLGGSAGLIMPEWPVPAAALVAAGGAFIVTAYALAVRRAGATLDGTTEVAGLVVLALGVLAGLGHLALAGGTGAIVVLALSEKARLHWIAHRIGEVELRAAFQFAVLGLVVLPVLPTGPYGPFDTIRPRALWGVVLLFSGLSYAGYLACRVIGPRRGQPLAGLLGGLFSSTAVTLQFARRSREEPGLAGPLALGVIAACTVVVARVMIICAVLNRQVALALIPYLAPAAVGSVAILAMAIRRTRPDEPAPTPIDVRSPLRLGSAIQLGVVLQVVLIAAAFVSNAWGTRGVLASAAVFGLTDIDALTFAMAAMGPAPAEVAVAARAIAIGVLATSLFKAAVASALGAPRFRAIAGGGVLGLAVAVAAGFLVTR